MNRIAMATAAVFLAAAPALAQDPGHHGSQPKHGDHPHHAQHGQHHGAQRPGGMMHGAGHCMGMMGGMMPGMAMMPMMALQHAEVLDLSADQVQRLEGLHDRAHEAGMEHMEQARAAHMEANRMLTAERPEFGAYEARLRQAAEHMVAAHVAMARVAPEVRDVLTAEQRAELEEMMSAMPGAADSMHHQGH